MQIISGVQKKHLRAVIYGPEGIGKSTLASRFPAPVFIDVEGGTHALDVARVQPPQSWAALIQLLETFAGGRGPADFQTLVIDTADWAEKMLRSAICQEAGVTALGDMPYGTLFQKLGAKWAQFLDLLSLTAERMHVVLLAHSQMVHCEIPEETGSFDRYELKLNTSFKVNTAAMTKEWASMVLFLNYEVMIVETNGKSKAQGGRRVCHTTHHASWDAKNRYNLPDKLKMPADSSMPPELSRVVAEMTLPVPAAAPPPAPPPPAPPTPPAAPVAPPAEPVAPAQAPPPAAPAPVISAEKQKMLDQLAELMLLGGISFADLDAQMAKRGIVPAGTPVSNYNEATLTRVINGWNAIQHNINLNKKQQQA